MRKIGTNGFSCSNCGKVLSSSDMVEVCNDCGAIFCEECVNENALKNHVCEYEDDGEFE